MVQQNVAIAIIIIVLFVVLAITAYVIWAIKNQVPIWPGKRRAVDEESQDEG